MPTTRVPPALAADLSPTGWGDPARRTGLPPHAAAWLGEQVGAPLPTPPGPPPPLRPAALPPAALAALTGAVGGDHVLQDDADRLLRAAGRSYLDLLRLRGAEVVDAPDAVVLPGSAEEVAAVLAVAVEQSLAVVPFGGGTSVVGGVSPLRGGSAAVVALDLRRMDRLVSVDEQALTAVFEPGVRGPAAEELLAAYGLTLGHFPQSYEHASLGGYAATRSAGQASTGYGRFDELVVALRVQTPAGPLALGRGAATAAGPDLLGVLLGSEGAYGVITEVTVRVRRAPQVQRYEGAFFASWAEGCAALRELEQERLAPDVARLSDPEETRVQLALAEAGDSGGGCLAVLGWAGSERGVAARRDAAVAVVAAHGGLELGTGVGERWEAGRYDGPYLREDLLDAGYLVETLETSATWSALDRTREAVRTALLAQLPGAVVMCHVSHLYPHGASLYFTVLAARAADDAAGQWQRAKDAACAAIVATGATITHHHAVGTDHRDWMTSEVGPLGVQVLRAVRSTLDPTGVLNPGKLLPTSPKAEV